MVRKLSQLDESLVVGRTLISRGSITELDSTDVVANRLYSVNDSDNAGFVVVNSGGVFRVGINDSSPSNTLSVNGDGSFLTSLTVGTQLYVNSGSAAAPTLSFSTDPDTGFYRYDTNRIGMSLGGTRYYAFSDGGFVVEGQSTENRSIEIGYGRSASGASWLDLVGDTTYTDYGTRLLRNAGSDGSTVLDHRGEGMLNLYCRDSDSRIRLSTQGLRRMEVYSSGLIVLNEDGYDADFRVESTSNVYAIMMDASASRVGINKFPSGYDLDVEGTIRSTGYMYPSGIRNMLNGTAGEPSYSFDSDTNTGMYLRSANRLAFSTAGTERVNINGHTLEMPGATTETISLEIGTGRSGNGYSYINLVGDATYTDYGLRIIRNNTGPNTTSLISHRGTGSFNIQTEDSASFVVTTNSSTALVINSAQGAFFEAGVQADGNITAGASPDQSVPAGTSGAQLNAGGLITMSRSGVGLVRLGGALAGAGQPNGVFNFMSDVTNNTAMLVQNGPGIGDVQQWRDSSGAEIASIGSTGIMYPTGIRSLIAGSETAPAYSFNDDTNTGLYSPAANIIGFVTGGIERGRWNLTELQVNNNLVAQGTSIFTDSMYLNASSPTAACQMTLGNGRSGNGFAYIDFVGDATYIDYGLRIIRNNTGANTDSRIYHRGTGTMYYICQDECSQIWQTNSLTRMKLTPSGYLGIGETSPECLLDVKGASNHVAVFNRTSTGTVVVFQNNSANAGNISNSGTVTSYNTTSDYRLKENLVPVIDAIRRVKALKPTRFNFIEYPDITVDGFIAHEVAEVVPEAVNGEKDAMVTKSVIIQERLVDSDLNEVQPEIREDQLVPEYQSMDNAKLVPILTSALQEMIAKVEQLEARISALESDK
jgi:hypothetical protein